MKLGIAVLAFGALLLGACTRWSNAGGSNTGGSGGSGAAGTAASAGVGIDLPIESRPVISRGVPAFASSEYSAGASADKANDADYATGWRSSNSSENAPSSAPQWLAYDLSAGPAAQRTSIVVFWFQSPENNYIQYAGYNLPGQYTIDGHSDPGGGAPPAEDDAGWTTLASVTDPPSDTTSFTSRQHYIPSFVDKDGKPCNWLRMHVTSINGQSYNWDVGIQLDVHDASGGLDDDWIFYGDSITAGQGPAPERGGFTHNPLSDVTQADFDAAGVGSLWATLGGTGTLSELVAADRPGHFPLIQMGGVAGWLSGDGVSHIPGWLSLFPGRIVGLNFGTNDAGWGVHASDFQANMQTLIDAADDAGKIVVIPTIPSPINANTVALNAVITGTLWNEPNVLPGPDLYAFFEANPGLLEDTLHPTDVGYVCYRQLWLQTLLQTVD